MPNETPSVESTLPAASDADIAALLSYDAPAPAKTETTTPAPTSPPPNPTRLADPAPDAKPSEEDALSVVDKALTTKKPRDYDGFDEREKGLLSKMANESYEFFAPLLRKVKGLGDLDKISQERELTSKQIAELQKARYYDHPEAYTLAEDYKEVANIRDVISQHLNFYADQLTKAESNQPVQFITKDPQGKFVLTEAIAPTPQLKTEITRRLQKLHTDSAEVERELGSLSQKYKQSFAENEKTVRTVIDQLFGKHREILKPAAEKELARFPTHLRHRPEYEGIAYALAAMKHIITSKRAEDQTAQAAALNKNVAKVAGLTSDKIATGAVGKPGVYDDKEYQMLKSL